MQGNPRPETVSATPDVSPLFTVPAWTAPLTPRRAATASVTAAELGERKVHLQLLKQGNDTGTPQDRLVFQHIQPELHVFAVVLS